jgi:hypothetical protein
MERPLLDFDRPLHIAFAEIKIGNDHQPAKKPLVGYPNGGLGSICLTFEGVDIVRGIYDLKKPSLDQRARHCVHATHSLLRSAQ